MIPLIGSGMMDIGAWLKGSVHEHFGPRQRA